MAAANYLVTYVEDVPNGDETIQLRHYLGKPSELDPRLRPWLDAPADADYFFTRHGAEQTAMMHGGYVLHRADLNEILDQYADEPAVAGWVRLESTADTSEFTLSRSIGLV